MTAPEHRLEVPGGTRHLLRWGLGGKKQKDDTSCVPSPSPLTSATPGRLRSDGQEWIPTTAPQRFGGFFVLFCWCISILVTQPDVIGGWSNAPELKCPMEVLPHPRTGQAKFFSTPFRLSLVSVVLMTIYNPHVHGGVVLTQCDLPTVAASC